MALSIYTNLGAENALRHFTAATRTHQLSMEKITSGVRLNNTREDAAGWAITNGMTAQVRGTNLAVTNTNLGMSMLQTMDGASEEVVTMLQRMRELSLQSLNDTYNNENRLQMDTEFRQLMTEIDRVAGTTKFNEVNVMANLGTKGSFLSAVVNNQVVQIGWEVGANVSHRNKLTISMGNFWTGASGANTIFGQATMTAANGSTAVVASAFSRAGISAKARASQAVMKIDSALSNIGSQRAKWGAMQNRLEFTLTNLSENTSSARKNIYDTGYANEAATMARAQVVQQSSLAMMSQANNDSQNVLSLLR